MYKENKIELIIEIIDIYNEDKKEYLSYFEKVRDVYLDV